jgi:flagellar basal body-associated protein FliL
MNDFDKDFNRTRKFIIIVGIIIIAASVVAMMLSVWFFASTAKEISNKGLKAVVEQIWEGPNK